MKAVSDPQTKSVRRLRPISGLISVLVVVCLANLVFATAPAMIGLSTTIVSIYQVLLIISVSLAVLLAGVIHFATNAYSMLAVDDVKSTDNNSEMKATAGRFADASSTYHDPIWRISNWITTALVMTMAWSLGMWTLFVFEFLSELASYWLVKESERSAMVLSYKISQAENA